ncbi:MAG: class A beta-lactamase-related serine hydrolase [Gammaproteobacteria bacterium]|nr:class A beta-lactamase-related serine hydrolase [Gammaproteobacteria bacterium]
MATVASSRRHASEAFVGAIERAIGECGEVGLQVAVYHHDELVVDAWGGIADETTGRKVDGDTLFPVFSVVKAVTATALHIQAERGLIEYDQPIARYWPEFAAAGKERATIRDALSHRLGIPQMPAAVTPELMSDYGWMVEQLAAMTPRFAPGTDNGYMCYTFGWVIAECVRRTDPQHRPFGTFVQEEICGPLGITDLWIGIPDRVESRIARIKNSVPRPLAPDLPIFAAIPPAVATVEEVFGRADVRRSCHPGANGIMNARSAARFFAMLAGGGALNGVRLISEQRVRGFCTPRPDTDRADSILGIPIRVGTAGFWLGGNVSADYPYRLVGRNPRILFHPGAGGSIGWADPDARLAIAICHNRMTHAPSEAFAPIREALVEIFGVA